MTTAFAELDSLRALQPQLHELGLQAELDYRLPIETISLLRSSGVLAASLATELGGTERSPGQLIQLVEELAYADSAAAWCTMVYLTTTTQAAFLPAEFAREVFGLKQDGVASTPLAAGAVAPSGRGQQASDGSIMASGQWAWGSGSHHADWIVGGTMLPDPADEKQVLRRSNGEPKVHLLFFKQDQVSLHDNWQPSGLRGTGSVDFDIQSQTAPAGRWTVLGDTEPRINQPLFHFPYFGLFASLVSAVCLGISRRAVDDFCDLAQGKVPAFGRRTINESSLTQMEFGRAEALQQAAWRSLLHVVEECWQRTLAGDAPSVSDRRHLRLAASQSVQLSMQAVDLLYHAGGGTSVRGDCSLQRHFRDIHVASQHRLVGVDNFRLAGGIRLNNKPAGSQL